MHARNVEGTDYLSISAECLGAEFFGWSYYIFQNSSAMVKEIKIVLDPYPTSGFFLSGSSITGEVVVETGSNKTNYNKIELVFVGRIDSDFTDRDNGSRCSYEQEIIRSSMTLWEKTETDATFPKGVTHLQFAMDIPSDQNILPSCENGMTKVQYKLNVFITKKKRGKSDPDCSTVVKIFPRVNIGSREMQSPISYRSTTPITSCLCISSGDISLDVRFRKAYTQNEVVEIEVEIGNETGKRISHFDAALMQNIECGGTAKQRFRRSRSTSLMFADETNLVGERVSGQSVLPRSIWNEKLYMRIPVTPPTTAEDSGSILNVIYYFIVRVHVSRNADKAIKLKCPVIIGTCNDYLSNEELADNQPHSPSTFSRATDNPPSYNEVFQSPLPTAPTLPSAPTLRHGENNSYNDFC